MTLVIFLSACVIVINIILQALANVFWLKSLLFYQHRKAGFWLISSQLIVSFLFFTLIHGLHTANWALLFRNMPATQAEFNSFVDAWYFSMVTFSTLGYGDITLHGIWRIATGMEAMNGIMLIGWTSALMFALVQNIYRDIRSQHSYQQHSPSIAEETR